MNVFENCKWFQKFDKQKETINRDNYPFERNKGDKHRTNQWINLYDSANQNKCRYSMFSCLLDLCSRIVADCKGDCNRFNNILIHLIPRIVDFLMIGESGHFPAELIQFTHHLLQFSVQFLINLWVLLFLQWEKWSLATMVTYHLVYNSLQQTLECIAVFFDFW